MVHLFILFSPFLSQHDVLSINPTASVPSNCNFSDLSKRCTVSSAFSLVFVLMTKSSNKPCYGGGGNSGSDVDLEEGMLHAGSSSDLRATKSVSPSHDVGKSSASDGK